MPDLLFSLLLLRGRYQFVNSFPPHSLLKYVTPRPSLLTCGCDSFVMTVHWALTQVWRHAAHFSPGGIISWSPPTSPSAPSNAQILRRPWLRPGYMSAHDSPASHIQTAQHHLLRNAIWLEARTRMHSAHLTSGCVSNEAWMYNVCFTT